MKQLINSPNFEFIFPSDIEEGELYTDRQFKKIALDFLDQIKDNKLNVDQGL